MDRKVAALAVAMAFAFACAGASEPPPVAPARVSSPAADAGPPAPETVSAPAGYVRVAVLGVSPNDDGSHVVVLLDEAARRLLPLAIGGTEAASIALRHSGEHFPRPLTHDLLDSALRAVGAEVVKVQIDALRDGVFHGSVFVRHADRVHTLDARPSDAIALALGRDAPIYVAESVLAAGGIRADDLPQEAPATMPPPPVLPPKP